MRIVFRRLMIMIYMLIIPEAVIFWAGRQWHASRYIAKKHKDKGWKKTHSFFAIMGGFVLYDEDDVVIETLSISRLEELQSEGKIRWPRISEEEIKDRSKGDFLSKAFVVLQTTWFTVQYIARAYYGLLVTEFELVALALAVLNGILYYFWWNKPLDVACPVPVYLLSSKQEAGPQTMDSEDGETPGHGISSIDCDSSFTTQLAPRSGENDKELNNEDHQISATTELLSSTQDPPPASAFTRYRSNLEGMVLFPLLPLIDMIGCESITIDTMDSPRSPLSVPTFYSPPMEKGSRVLPHIVGIVICIFGWIHTGYFLRVAFPSLTEEKLWRASAATITFMPTIFTVFSYLHTTFTWIRKTFEWMAGPINLRCGEVALHYIWLSIVWVCLGLYFIARVACLILPLFALRSFPPESLSDVNWSSFIPHI